MLPTAPVLNKRKNQRGIRIGKKILRRIDNRLQSKRETFLFVGLDVVICMINQFYFDFEAQTKLSVEYLDCN